jgi:pentatricopeptide repeat protein
LLNMYSSLGFVGDACKVFDNMPVKDVVAWNSMLDACVRWPDGYCSGAF